MNIYTNNEFEGSWPVGTAAIVSADSPEQAADALNQQLRLRGLKGDAKQEDMKLFTGGVLILQDGNY